MKDKQVIIRLSKDEKKSFEIASKLSGISLSSWMRERLRVSAIRELENAKIKVDFVESIKVEL